MPQKKVCTSCGYKYTPEEDECPDIKMCDECFLMQGDGREQIDTFSDADPGL